jgi:hypothetical protein
MWLKWWEEEEEEEEEFIFGKGRVHDVFSSLDYH